MELSSSTGVKGVLEEVGAVIRLESLTARSEVRALTLSADVGINAVHEIDPKVAPRRQPAKRAPVGTDASDKPIDILADALLEHVSGSEGSVAVEELRRSRDEAIGSVPRAAVRTRRETGSVVLRLRKTLRAGDEARRHRHVRQRRKLKIEVSAESCTRQSIRSHLRTGDGAVPGKQTSYIELRYFIQALFATVVPLQEVAKSLRAPRYAGTVLLLIRGGERREILLGEEVECSDAIQNAGTGGDRRQVAVAQHGRAKRPRRGVSEISIRRRISVMIAQPAVLEIRVPSRAPDLSTLGGDDEHSVRGISTVKRGGGGPLHNFNALDLIRVDVAQAAWIRPADANGRRAGRALHSDPVDDDNWIVR